MPPKAFRLKHDAAFAARHASFTALPSTPMAADVTLSLHGFPFFGGGGVHLCRKPLEECGQVRRLDLEPPLPITDV